MASFYIKTDEKEVFRGIIEEVKKTLSVEIPEINITYRESASGKKTRSSAVSYTHLDVYKRQGKGRGAEAGGYQG